MKQLHVALLLLGRGIAPEPSQAESRHPFDIDPRVDDLGQPLTLVALAARAVHDRHELVADAFDEVAGMSARLGQCGVNQPAGGRQQRGCGQNQEVAAEAWCALASVNRPAIRPVNR
jgi:hypothetical protein